MILEVTMRSKHIVSQLILASLLTYILHICKLQSVHFLACNLFTYYTQQNKSKETSCITGDSANKLATSYMDKIEAPNGS